MRPAALLIRSARTEERGHLEDLQRRASLAGAYRDQLLEFPDAISLPAAHLERGEALIAEVDGRIAGFAVILDDGGKAELDGLFVDPDYWRRGIGSALVAEAVGAARRRGLSLVTVVASPEAAAFYVRCGFAVEGRVDTRFGPAVRLSR